MATNIVSPRSTRRDTLQLPGQLSQVLQVMHQSTRVHAAMGTATCKWMNHPFVPSYTNCSKAAAETSRELMLQVLSSQDPYSAVQAASY